MFADVTVPTYSIFVFYDRGRWIETKVQPIVYQRRFAVRNRKREVLAACLISFVVLQRLLAAEPQSRPRTTVLGTQFSVHRVFDQQIETLIKTMRANIRKHRRDGKLIAFISTPLSARGGGYTPINVEVSGFVKQRLEKHYGEKWFWALAPGQPLAPDELPIEIKPTGGLHAGGGDYLFLLTQLIAGEDGLGQDFDMVYFTGPNDFHQYVRHYLGVVTRRTDDWPVLGQLHDFIDRFAKTDPHFKSQVADHPEARRRFLRYYALRASSVYSTGAHDEWNIFVKINRKRTIADSIAMYFDGRHLSAGEMEWAIRRGYERSWCGN